MEFSVHPLLAGSLEQDAAGFLVQGSPFLHHRYFDSHELLQIAKADLQGRWVADAGVVFALRGHDGALAGFCCCSRASWDSRYFGYPMARLECWGLASMPPVAIAALVRTTLEAARERHGYRHVTCRVAEGGYSLINALASLGFSLVDVQRVYVARNHPGHGRSLYAPRAFTPGDQESLLRLFQETHFQSRYTRDKSLSRQKTSDMYAQWVANFLGLPDTEREIYVLERGGVVVAAGAGRYVDFAGAGVAKKMMTEGIFAGGKGYAGAYIGITQAVVGAAMAKGCPVAELKVSADNHAANRVLQSLGYEGVSQSYSFHNAF